MIGLHPTALGVIRALTSEGVACIALVEDQHAPSAATRLCRRKIPCRISEPSELINALQSLAGELTEPAVLFPCGDADVLTVSEHRAVLSNNYRFVLPDHENLTRLIDKTEFTLSALEAGLPIPSTSVVNSAGELEDAAARAQFPCLVKPWRNTPHWERVTGSQKVVWVRSADELRHLYTRVAAAEPRIIVQDWIEGRDDDIYATFVYFDRQSQAVACFSSRKLRQWLPLRGSTSAAVPHPDPDLERRTTDILRQFGLRGLGSIEWKRDARDGKLRIVEPTVGRCDLNSPVAMLWGLNVPYLAYCDAAGFPLPPVVLEPQSGCWIQEEYELFSVLHYLKQGELTLASWWRSLPAKRILAHWSWTDPMPGVKLTISLMGRMIRKGLRRLLSWRRPGSQRKAAVAELEAGPHATTAWNPAPALDPVRELSASGPI